MDRRDFLRTSAIVPAGLAFANLRQSFAKNTRRGWRTFELITRVEVLKPSGPTRIWAPAALIKGTPYQQTLSNTFRCEGGKAKIIEVRRDALGIVSVEFPPGIRPVLTVTSRVATKDWSVNLSFRNNLPKANPDQLRYFLRPTKLLPTDGIVKETASAITSRARTDLDKARAIYEWIVERTYRNPKTRGCGIGNIRFMLESGDLGGKCADLNALYVGLARSAGLPARDVYGIRAAASRKGYKSLGAASDNVTRAQHCRAEVYLNEHGWVPVDPADVRKVMLEEPPVKRGLGDEMVKRVRAQLFGSWEMNWIAYNFAQDIVLAGSDGRPIEFLMYPQAETADGRLDSLDPDGFKYEITSKEI